MLMFSLVGCSKELNSINDFSKFSSLKQDETNKIEVEFDNYSGAPFYFTIEAQNDIDEVMNIIFTSSFKRMEKEVNGGDHTSITIIQGEDQYKLHVFMNKEGKYYYSFETTELQEKITELARKAGAFKGGEEQKTPVCRKARRLSLYIDKSRPTHKAAFTVLPLNLPNGKYRHLKTP